MQNFRDLRVWQASRELTAEIYRLTAVFPEAEKFGLTSQLRRAAVSVAANIAEGCGRGTRGDLTRFLDIGMGSAAEVEAELQLACDLGFISEEAHASVNMRVLSLKRTLGALIIRIRSAMKAEARRPTTDD